MFNFSKYGKILMLIILLDIATTVLGLNLGIIIEVNPLMAYLISFSMLLFVSVKLLVSALGLKALEWYAHRTYYLVTIWSYAGLYLSQHVLISFLVYFFPSCSFLLLLWRLV